jgi:hypothetical protein
MYLNKNETNIPSNSNNNLILFKNRYKLSNYEYEIFPSIKEINVLSDTTITDNSYLNYNIQTNFITLNLSPDLINGSFFIINSLNYISIINDNNRNIYINDIFRNLSGTKIKLENTICLISIINNEVYINDIQTNYLLKNVNYVSSGQYHSLGIDNLGRARYYFEKAVQRGTRHSGF